MRVCLRMLLLLGAVCGPRAVFAHDSNCEIRLILQNKMQDKLGYLPLFSSERMRPFTKAEGVERHMITAKHPRFGMTLAFLDYTRSEDGRTIEIEKVDVLNANSFNRGLSNALFAEMIQAEPGAVKLRVSMHDVNLRALKAALLQSPDPVLAMQATPMYKTMRRFGFTRVTLLECNPATDEYEFALELESAH